MFFISVVQNYAIFLKTQPLCAVFKRYFMNKTLKIHPEACINAE